MSKGVEAADVNIEGAINVNAIPISPFKVTIPTGDLVLIVSMIEDYIQGLDILLKDDMMWQVYYRGRYKGISERIQKAINYDFEKSLEKCRKKAEKDANNDIGEEAMVLAVKKAKKEAEIKQKKESERHPEKKEAEDKPETQSQEGAT